MNGLIGIKIDQTQKFLENGRRIPVTMVKVPGNIVMQIKGSDKHGYSAIQVGIGNRKNPSKPLLGHAKQSHTQQTKAPQYIKEIRVTEDDLAQTEVGSAVAASDVFAVGDVVMVTGQSKGKGFAGGVKRHHFKGGPRTHGQSDRERAPGSIGQTTTPGRVYRGKRMAGRMGNEQVTIQNLEVVNINGDELWLMGLIPGVKNSLVVVQKTGTNKKFTPLYQEVSSEEAPAAQDSAAPTSQAPEPESPTETQTTEPENTESSNAEEAAVAETVSDAVDTVQPEEANRETETEETTDKEETK